MNKIMARKNITILLAGAAALSILCAMLLASSGAKVEKTYTNPVLVETFTIHRNNPDNFSGVLGIGDPDVLFHDGKYYLYPTGDNYGYPETGEDIAEPVS